MHKEILIPISVILLAVAFLDPFMYWMSQSVVYVSLVLLFFASLTYALFIWREKPQDEREYMHRAFAARVAYLSGVLVLVASIIYQVLIFHTVDPFIIATLAVMTVAKYIGLIYIQGKN